MPILPDSRPASEQEIDAFLSAFEAGTLPKEEFTHAGHLLAGACYVYALGESSALAHMRQCVRRFNEAVGGRNTETSGYHETITVFWIKLLAALRSRHPETTRSAFASLAVESFRDRCVLLQEFYGFDVVNSLDARRIWVEPLLKSITAANL